MTVFDKILSYDKEQLIEFLSRCDSLEYSPWGIWWDNTYCKNCATVTYTQSDDYSPLGISCPNGRELKCAYCEIPGSDGIRRCRFFPESNDDELLNNKKLIELWLNSEAEDGE